MRTTILAGTAMLVFLLGAGSASALDEPEATTATASAKGCSGVISTTDASGAEISRAMAPGTAGASSRTPLVVDYGGRASYTGGTDVVITDHSWYAKVNGLTVRTGNATNVGQDTTRQGDVVIADVMPFRITGLYFVEVGMKGTGGECTGAIWVKLAGNPLTTLPFWGGVIFVLLGLAGLWWAWPSAAAAGVARHPIRGLLAGLALGLGLVVLLLVTAIVGFSAWWPLAVVFVAAIALGVLAGSFLPALGSSPPAPPAQEAPPTEDVPPAEATPAQS